MNSTSTLSVLLAEIASAPAIDPAASPRPPAPGDELGRFRLVREIGRGSFGVVFEAADGVTGERVALKAVRPGRHQGQASRMLEQEAQALRSIRHPSVVRALGMGRSACGPYLVTELLRGRTLESRVRSGRPMAVPEALGILEGVARALAAAHAAGVVHGDLKPANVFLAEPGGVKLLDFGLSRSAGADGVSGGTPPYMAPEQWRGQVEGTRADVFAFGVLLHLLLSGRLPFAVRGGHSEALDDRPLPPLGAGAGRALRRVRDRCLARDPARRFADGSELLEALLAARPQPSRAARLAVRLRALQPVAARWLAPAGMTAVTRPCRGAA
ncbi:MAG TPA: serine/threonine-protein kinase [Anaeromyxobacteraceae bacterium]|jgi:serine/threonine protein kinase